MVCNMYMMPGPFYDGELNKIGIHQVEVRRGKDQYGTLVQS
jgi:hypothetical protein